VTRYLFIITKELNNIRTVRIVNLQYIYKKQFYTSSCAQKLNNLSTFYLIELYIERYSFDWLPHDTKRFLERKSIQKLF